MKSWPEIAVGHLITEGPGVTLTVSAVHETFVVCHSSVTLMQHEVDREDLLSTSTPGRWRLVALR